MIAVSSYVLNMYIIMPIVWRSLQFVYNKRYDLCPLVKCIQPLSVCLQDVECRRWLDEVAECQDPSSSARQRATRTFQHVQHPENPAYCQYQSFDTISSPRALTFLECIGKSHCLPPSAYSDTCATVEHASPFDSTITNNLAGRWLKVYTTGWDLWPCQWTDFWPPSSEDSTTPTGAATTTPPQRRPPPPEDWMTAWPHDPTVWRMDLYWTNTNHDNWVNASLTFHMSNEMYLGETWDFTPFTTTSTSTPPGVGRASLKTRAVMWGTEAHENWYLLDYHPEWNMMLVYYCAYTEAVRAFDSMAMVLIKHQPPALDSDHNKDDEDKDEGASSSDYGGENNSNVSVELTTEQSDYYERKTRELLGDFYGRLQRIRPCQT